MVIIALVHRGNSVYLLMVTNTCSAKQDAPESVEEQEVSKDNYGYEASFFKKGDVVLVRDKDGQNWLPGIYVEYRNDSFGCRNYDYEQCIPYEGNEHLLDTSDKPEQRSQSKNTLFGIKLKPGYVLEFGDGKSGVLFPLYKFSDKEKFAIRYTDDTWEKLDFIDTTQIITIYDFVNSHTSNNILWKKF